jgi:phage replication-related protein YjqB (UPF0714/DUF867 family)
MDKYANFAALEAAENKQRYAIYQREGTSGVAVIAPHGGGIEPGTLELADSIAGTNHAYYAFDGKKKNGSTDLHITSTNFDEPVGVEIAWKSQTVVAIHGCGGDEDEVVYLGGLHKDLKLAIKQALTEAGFKIGEHGNPNLQGVDGNNICNRCAGRSGVQLELPEGLRSRMFKNLTRAGRAIRTEVFDRFVKAMRAALADNLKPNADHGKPVQTNCDKA